jgi:starch phosphorylase
MYPSIPTRPPEHLDLPEPLARLSDLAYNQWWTWHREARRLFTRIDEPLWERYRNPVRLISLSRTSLLRELAEDSSFLGHMHEVLEAFDAEMAGPCMEGPPVAYVSAEYALHESLPIYSGGLGVLSGDHLKEASDMGMPMVGVGLFYRRGYFRQHIDSDGYQQHNYPELDGLKMPILRVADRDGNTLRVPVELPGRTVQLRVWVTFVGRVPLLLLDSYTGHNQIEDLWITSQLYVKGRDMRLTQEVVLGRGAVSVLDALDIDPRVWHMNEGHSAFLAVENLRRSGESDLGAAIQACRPNHVFTTHTPVPAGNEVFETESVRPYLESTARHFNTVTETLLDLGNTNTDDNGMQPGFNLTALALKLSGTANGVSQLHAEVSQQMWPDYKIHGITNGIHMPTWMGREMGKVLKLVPGEDPQDVADRAQLLSDEEIWAAHTAQKHRLMRYVRARALVQAARHGHSPEELRRIEGLLAPSALTLGFARRFAPYKRADLLFDDPERLERLLCDRDRPVQLVMAGKAHPADRAGQKIIENVWQLAQEPHLRGRIVFVEDYDVSVGRLMVRGVDVWLNNPEWPREASGTSGMKAVANGVLHCSVPDGWWAECHGPDVGFTIGEQAHPERERDSQILYDVLENQVRPLYYQRGDDGLPREWIALMRNSMVAFIGRFSTRRMLTDYAEKMYGLNESVPVA